MQEHPPRNRRLPWRLLVQALLLSVGLSAIVTGPAQATQPAAVVKMTDAMRFNPSSVSIHVGDTVRWQSDSVLVHTVTADPSIAVKQEDVALPEGADTFNSGNITPGTSFAHTFEVAGTYRYFCIPHESAGMVGTVVVKP